MTKYIYTFDEDTSKVIRIFDRELIVNKDISSLTPQKKFEYFRQKQIDTQELKTVSIENNWFDLISKKYNIIDIIDGINDIIKNGIKQEKFNNDTMSTDITYINLSIKEKMTNEIKIELLETELLGINEQLKIIQDEYSWINNYMGLEDIKRPEYSFNGLTKEYSDEIIRDERNIYVRSLEDSVADLAKWNSLLTTVVSRMYDMFSDSAKGKITKQDKEFIEYTFDKFSKTNTRADSQLEIEGLEIVDKILTRESKINDIIKNIKAKGMV